MTENKIRLSHLASGLGCGCKLKPQTLEEALKNFKSSITDPAVMVGQENSDDAAVYKISEDIAIVQSVDFFTPIVDDPFTFGAIAAANALSDIYAMGAKPIFALNLVSFPVNKLPVSVLSDIMSGASHICAKAGITIPGGHSIDDPEPKFGLVVSGIIKPQNVVKNNMARPGDMLVFTKAIGTGIITTAMKKDIATEAQKTQAVNSMMTLNDVASGLFEKYNISAATDVSGFGLLGHLLEMARASLCHVKLRASAISFMNGLEDLLAKGMIPGGTKNNMAYTNADVGYAQHISDNLQIMLNDAQTSGGLLIAVKPEYADALVNELKGLGVDTTSVIGEFNEYLTGEYIRVM